MNKFDFKNIEGLHLELTTKCNANCPMCSRNYKGKTHKNLKLVELSLKDCKTILPVSFIKQLKLISLCGVYGDPICCNDIKGIVKYLYSCNPKLHIDLYTNGSMFNVEWWTDYAKILKKYNGSVIFGIDGIGAISQLHRCNTDYNKVIENAKAFISAGGNAQWDYIVFKHNEHQVDDARCLSKQLGFKTFQIKKTSRFFKNLYESDPKLDSTISNYGKHPVFNSEGIITHYLELPEQLIYRNSTENQFFDRIKKYGSINKYLDIVKIDCQALKTKGIFISAFGEVFPCCTVYQQVCYPIINEVVDKEELNEYAIYKNSNLSAFYCSIKEIVESDFFTNLSESWKIKGLCNGKPKSCSRACGIGLDVHNAQHTEKINILQSKKEKL